MPLISLSVQFPLISVSSLILISSIAALRSNKDGFICVPILFSDPVSSSYSPTTLPPCSLLMLSRSTRPLGSLLTSSVSPLLCCLVTHPACSLLLALSLAVKSNQLQLLVQKHLPFHTSTTYIYTNTTPS